MHGRKKFLIRITVTDGVIAGGRWAHFNEPGESLAHKNQRTRGMQYFINLDSDRNVTFLFASSRKKIKIYKEG